ncbi:MAG: flagellar biosynthetic protein FliO [Pseudomonadota bacterium]|nr:flagellar biosynthetic protein FliO [Pseudomonadota bacterium]
MRRWQSLSLVAGIAALTRVSLVQAANAAVVAAAAPSPAGMLQVTFGLLVVVGLLFAVMWSLKKMGAGKHAPAGAVKVVGGVSVGNRERILVVEVADQWIVVGVTPTTISALSTMPRQVGVDLSPTAPLAKNFSAWLKQTIDKRNAGVAAAVDSPGSSHAS